jgi:hypothetical protein
MILNMFDKDKERIDVPLTADLSGNMLQKQWGIFERLIQASMLVEEVFAVRMSVVQAREKGLITDNILLDKVVSHYKVVYGGMISRFEEAYNEYDFIAKGLGEEAAFALIFKMLETVNPNKAFLDILFSDFPITICITDPRTPTGERLNLPLDKPTNEQSHRLISWITDQLDPDDSRYQRSDMLKIAPMIKRDLSKYAQILGDGTSIFSDSPTDFLFSEYNDTIDSLLKVDASTGLIYGKVGHGACLLLLLEAILQQLSRTEKVL